MSQDKPRTLAEIAAENQRIRDAAPEPETPKKQGLSKAEVLAGLMSRMSSRQAVNMPVEIPVMVEPEKPKCPVCGGRGRISSGAVLGEPGFGQLIPCPVSGCMAVKAQNEQRLMSMREQVARQFGLTPEYYEYASMSHYDDDDNRLSVRCARLYLRDGLITGQDRIKHSIVFCGKVGTGKTYLMSAIRNELEQRGIYAPFMKIRTLVKGVQRGYSEDAELRDYQAENVLRTCPVLFIDELETGQRSGDRTDILESVIDYRCLHDMPTIIATNLEQDEVADVWNHRIQSRLIHMAWWVALSGKTQRDTSPVMK